MRRTSKAGARCDPTQRSGRSSLGVLGFVRALLIMKCCLSPRMMLILGIAMLVAKSLGSPADKRSRRCSSSSRRGTAAAAAQEEEEEEE